MLNRNTNGWIKVAVLLLAIAVVFVSMRFLPIREWMERFTEWMKANGTVGMVLYVVIFITAATAFIPASPFTIAGAMAFGFWKGGALVMTSVYITSAISFLISRHFARGFIEKKLAGHEKLKAFDAAIARDGWKVVFLLRLVPVFPFFVTNYFFGLTKVRFWPYWIASIFGMTAPTMLYVYLGYMGKVAIGDKHHQRTPQETLFLVLGLAATIAVVAYITHIAKKSLQQMEAHSRSEAQAQP